MATDPGTASAPLRQPCPTIDHTPDTEVRAAGVIDWHGFHSALRRAALAATQSGAPLSLLMLEIASGEGLDPAPDPTLGARAMERLSGIIAELLAPDSALARYGEERLAVILVGIGLSEAVAEAERIGRRIAPQDDLAPADAAIGVAQFRDDESLGHLIERLTDAARRARSDGRPIAVAQPSLRRRPWPVARGTDATLCPCGLYTSPCACGLF